MPDKKIKIRNEEDKTIYECSLEQDTNKKVPVAKYIIITILAIAISVAIGFLLSVVIR